MIFKYNTFPVKILAKIILKYRQAYSRRMWKAKELEIYKQF